MADKLTKKTPSALVSEKNAANNPDLEEVVQSRINTFIPRREGTVRRFQEDHLAMIVNEKSVYVWMLDGDGNKTHYQLLFRAGWYLSVEENYLKEQALKDPDNLSLNEQIWAAMEEAGQITKKRGAGPKDVKVVS